MTSHDVPSTYRGRATKGALIGGCFGALLLGVGVIRIVVALLSGTPLRESLPEFNSALAFAVIYCGGFAAAGATLGALWPLRRRLPGALLLGYVGAGIVSTCVGLLIREGQSPKEFRTLAITVVIMTLAFGTVVGYQIWRWERS